MSANDANPSTFLGGTWEAWGSGRVPVGVDISQEDFNETEKTGGSNSVTLITANLPSHYHGVNLTTSENGNHGHKINARSGQLASGTAQNGLGTGSNNNGQWDTDRTGNHTHTVTGNTGSTGSGKSFSVIQSYITCYMWKRIA